MKISRENIFDYISYIQLHLGIWNRKLTPNTLSLLQKIYESYVNELPKDKNYILTSEEIAKLEYSIISIVAHDGEDQESLTINFKNWNKQYQKSREKDDILEHFGFDETINESFKEKNLTILKGLGAFLLITLFYFIYVSIWSITLLETPKVESFTFTQIDSITPVSFDIDSLIDYDYIQYISPETKEWISKTDPSSGFLNLPDGTLYYDNTNFGSLEFQPNNTKSSLISFNIKSEKNFFGFVNQQEIRLNANFLDTSKVVKVEKKLKNIFPEITYQNYPFPNRTLKLIDDNPKLETSFVGKYKLPICLLLSLMAWWILFYRKKKKAVQSNQKKAKFGHPYFWMIDLPNAPSIELCEDVDKSIHILRNKIPSGRNTLNVPKTIHKTVKSGGYVSFQYAEESLKTEYLFLIGYKSQSDHSSKMWKEIALSLNAKDINTSVFHYNSDIRLCYSDHFKNGLSLKELYNHYSNSILVIIGEHYNFFNPFTGKLNNWLNVFENWSSRYLLTSKNYYSWDKREDELGKLFHVLPAKVSSLSLLQVSNQDSAKIKYIPNPDEHLNDYNQEFTLNELKISFTKVQKDWIAACCLFPNLHYDLSLAFGKLVFAHHNKDFSSTEIEEVFSLPWFAEGHIPDDIRKTLIKEFETRNQSLVDEVRSFIAHEIKYHNPPSGSHASDWFREGILINEMLNETAKPSTRRREKIEKELRKIYKRGLESDIQIKNSVNDIKNPSWILRTRRWLSKTKNIMKLFALAASFVFPYILFSLFFNTELCSDSFPSMNAVPLNYELSASLFDAPKASANIQESTILCRSTIDEEISIYEENLLRSDIFLGTNDLSHEIFSDSLFSSAAYEEPFRKNIAVDIYNTAIKGAVSLRKVEIIEDEEKKNVASQFCEQIQLSKKLIETGESTSKFEFEDSLAISLKWCNDNIETPVNEKKSGAYGLNDDIYFRATYDVFERQTGFPLDKLTALQYSSNKSKLLFSKRSQLDKARNLALQLSSILNNEITSEFSTNPEVQDYIYVLYWVEPTANGEVDKCELCKRKLGSSDNDPPVFVSGVDNIITTANNSNCEKRVTWQTPNVTDNCDLKSLVSTKNSGDVFTAGETVVTYTATDMCDNSDVLRFTVTVNCDQTNQNSVELVASIRDKSTNESLNYALVQVQGTQNKVYTDTNGKFRLTVNESAKFIDISKDGYKAKSVSINNIDIYTTIPLEREVIDNEFQISGNVLDESGTPLIGVNVILKGTSLVTITDIDGKFTLIVPNRMGSIVVSYTGYESKTIDFEKATLPSDIILKKSKPSTFNITGTLVDSNGDGLFAGNIVLKGTSIGASTDIDGGFTLIAPEKKGIIEASYTGYISESINLEKASMPLTIQLKSDRSETQQTTQQNRSYIVKGKVLSGKEPLIGASVLVKGTSNGTVTDIEGAFSLEVSSDSETLVISYTGYKSKEEKLDPKKTFLSINLEEY